MSNTDSKAILIHLTQSRLAVIDEEDFPLIAPLKWCAVPGRNGTWYAESWINGRAAYMHTLILGVPASGFVIDHADRDGLNCRRANLRYATHGQNAANSIRSRPTASGFRGVYPEKGSKKWGAIIKVDGKCRRLGWRECAEDAARLYDEAAREAFGQFATLNFPDDLR